jgi:shikimate kinase
MIIAFFGITCVGKTTIGRIVANELRYAFFDLDTEMKIFYNDTITNIQRGCFGDAYDTKKGLVLKDILGRCGDKAVISMSPIYYTTKYKLLFRNKKVFSIVLHDSPENIAKRMIETDEDDNIIENLEIDLKENIKDARYFISRYKKAFERIEYKYDIAGKIADVAAIEIIETIIRPYGTLY